MTDKKIKEIIKHFIDFIGEEDGFEEMHSYSIMKAIGKAKQNIICGIINVV